MSQLPEDMSLVSKLRSLVLLQGSDLLEKLLSLAALIICIELVFFKFLPDLGTAVVDQLPSKLTDWFRYKQYFMTPDSVHYARFMGNQIVLWTATWIGNFMHSADPRLHPLRIASGVLTALYAYGGAILALQRSDRYSWRYFMVPYAVAAIIGLYVFYPGDMPSFALLSICLYFLLDERLAPALLFMLLTGLFRESSLHAVFFILVWALCSTSRPVGLRLAWMGIFAVAFVVEYLTIRHFYAGPVSSAGGLIFDVRYLFLERGMYSLTTICSLGLALVFPIGCLLRLRRSPSADWRARFFRINCYAFPLWIVFYRMLNGNISEFRLLLPVILPCIYGIGWASRSRTAAMSPPTEDLIV